MSLEKILTADEAEEKISELKKQGKIVVFANGCFDFLHVGHIRYLQGAKAAGDVLVVAINGDESVRKLKGENRPLQTADERAEIVAALECVDFVTIFDELTADAILFKLRPDIQAKGTDYTIDTVPEKETIRRIGAKIIIVGDPKNHSSSDILEKRKQN